MELLKALLVLALMIYMAKKRVNTGPMLFISALVLGLLFGLNPLKLGSLIYDTLRSSTTLNILGALLLINILEGLMRHSGVQSQLVESLKHISGNPRFTLAALPAIIGMLPSAGGARFSAPLVEEAAKGLNISRESKAAINYYFRHIWEHTLPLYPANLLAVAILGITFTQFSRVMMIFIGVNLVLGYYHLKGISVPSKREGKKQYGQATLSIAEGLWPILAVMLMVLGFHISLLWALLMTDIGMFIIYKYKKQLPSIGLILKEALAPSLFFMIFSAIYFRDILTASGGIQMLVNFFQSTGLNSFMSINVIAFAVSLLTGLTIPGITVALPMVVAIASPDNLLSLASLVFISGFIGTQLSPLHLCFIMSLNYFEADFFKTWRKIMPPQILLYLFAMLYSYVLYRF